MCNNNFAELEKLPTWQLDQMLQDENTAPETIRHILAVLQEREKDLPVTVSDSERLALERYKLREKTAGHKTARKYKWALRAAGIVVAVCAVTVGIAQTVQADAFWERIVRWSDSVIEFFSPQYADGGQQAYEFRTNHPGLQQMYDTVTEMGITEPVVPMWLPEGYALVFCQDMRTDDQMTLVAVFQNGEKIINYNVTVYLEGTPNRYQKDETEAKTVEFGGIKHYIVRNIDKWVTVWTKDEIECSISVDCQEDTLYKILRSIYYKEETR